MFRVFWLDVLKFVGGRNGDMCLFSVEELMSEGLGGVSASPVVHSLSVKWKRDVLPMLN